MKNEKQTTVNLTEVAQVIKDDLAPVFGLKNILSAGLILFDKLTDKEQKQIVKYANNIPTTEPPVVRVKSLIQQAESESKKKDKRRPSA